MWFPNAARWLTHQSSTSGDRFYSRICTFFIAFGAVLPVPIVASHIGELRRSVRVDAFGSTARLTWSGDNAIPSRRRSQPPGTNSLLSSHANRFLPAEHGVTCIMCSARFVNLSAGSDRCRDSARLSRTKHEVTVIVRNELDVSAQEVVDRSCKVRARQSPVICKSSPGVIAALRCWIPAWLRGNIRNEIVDRLRKAATSCLISEQIFPPTRIRTIDLSTSCPASESDGIGTLRKLGFDVYRRSVRERRWMTSRRH
jgi:hypothetical protein